MYIIGINDAHDSGAALIKDGKIISAINEERLNRIKLSWGFPNNSIRYLLKYNKLQPKDISYIAVATKYASFIKKATDHQDISRLTSTKFNRKATQLLSPLLGIFFKTSLWKYSLKLILKTLYTKRQTQIKNLLLKKYKFKCPIKFIDHHTAHVYSTYYPPEGNFLIITSDGAGDTLCSTISIANKGKIKRIYEINEYNSIAMFYTYVTMMCGFKPMSHEGKITGLAAYGNPIYYNKLKGLISYKNKTIINNSHSKHESCINKIKKVIGYYKKEDMAASIQKLTETEITKLIDYWAQKTKLRNILLAGGLFANVKLNQRILNSKNIDSIFIHPNMGDGGLAVGATLYLNTKINKNKFNEHLDHVYFGPSYSNKEIEEELKRNKLKYTYYEEIEKEIASLLAKGKVVARFNGAMEYGPRALGNRSILYQATDPTVNDWLNKKLKRTEFMPFAPVTAMEDASKCYKDIKGAEQAAKFMTITFDCTDYMKKNMPAVVHIDGTARPQLIVKKDNTSYYKILKEYKKLTGLPSIINTSFNMHEEPIVCTPSDAIRSFKSGHLDYLAIGDYLVKN